jgi:serine/threonine protein phosphatase PrpC
MCDRLSDRCAVLSTTGLHHDNEDRYCYTQKQLEKFSMDYYGVYDGHGGSYVVDYVKENLHLNIFSQLESPPQKSPQRTDPDSILRAEEEEDDSPKDEDEEKFITKAIKKAFLNTDKYVIDECRSREDWSGSCVCSVMKKGNSLYLANLGDSSAVMFQFMPETKVIHRSVVLSTAHKPKLEEDRINAAGGWVSPDGYILGVLACSRSMGDRELKYYEDYTKSGLKTSPLESRRPRGRNSNRQKVRNNNKDAPPSMKHIVSPKPEIDIFNIDQTDALLVIGSDGLWDFVSPKQSVAIVNDAWTKQHNIEDVCEALVRAAKRAKSADDITAMVINLTDSV